MPLIELRKAGLSAVSQHPINVYYHADLVGNFIADIIVGEQVILEIKAITQLSKAHEVQLVNYLTSTFDGPKLMSKPVSTLVAVR